jgi:hypothetical protein
MCHLDRETSQAEMMKPRDLGAETEKKLISVSEGKLYVGSTVLTENPSSDVPNWKAVGSAGKQMHFPRCLKSPFE